MNKPLPLNLNVEPVPPELREIFRLLVEGQITDLVFLARTSDGGMIDGFGTGMCGHGESDVYAMLGALEGVKRDWMRTNMEPRVRYLRLDDRLDGDGPEEVDG